MADYALPDSALEQALRTDSKRTEASDEVKARCRSRAKAMLAKIKKTNPKQYELIRDSSPHVSGLCPRRAGKSYAGAAAALITGEAKPGSVSLIISLNLKQLRRLYWKGGASGLWAFNKEFNLNLEFNSTYLRWEHENGSSGYLLGAEDEDQLEVIRGLEADIYIIDECKSFSIGRLETLIDDIIDPQLASRQGKLVMIGTPGFNPAGPFYQATCIESKDIDGRPYMLPFGRTDEYGRTPEDDLLWSCHTWTLQENTAKPKQWGDALRKKKQKRWADDNATWMREYLGHWTAGGDGLVFRYGAEKQSGRVTWTPQYAKDNPTGLPKEGAPWRLIGGLDMGYEAPTAFVVAAYSAKLRQLRHVWDTSQKHLLVPDIADVIQTAIDRFGTMEVIYADAGNLGITIVNTLIQEYGFPLVKADKREKMDYIELLNGAFADGEVQIIERSTAISDGWESKLEEQLLTNAWEDSDADEKEREQLARVGRLKEDKNIPNDSTDALLYLYRGSLHHFGVQEAKAEPVHGSPEWVKKWEKEQLEKARASFRQEVDAKLGTNGFDRAPIGLRPALEKTWKIPLRPSLKRTGSLG